jgi:hypothetical protein
MADHWDEAYNEGFAAGVRQHLNDHDHLCPPGIKLDREQCLTCRLLSRARAEEWQKILTVIEQVRYLRDTRM